MISPRIFLSIRFLCGLMAILSAARLDAAQQAVAAAPASTGFVDVDGGKLYYEESGQGAQTVVLIHDGVVDSAVWNDVWSEFCQHFHTVRYDRRGFGKSPAATSWYSEVDDLAAVLQRLRLGHAALVGSSHGGGLAIDFTLAHPEIVQELANDAARKKLLNLLTANPQDLTHAGGDMIMAGKPALGRLDEIKTPTLIVTGDADIPDVHAHAGAIEAGIPRAHRAVMEGAGHLLYLEKPSEFARLAISFLEANRTTEPRQELRSEGD